ncbi:MAG: hypothetical protein CVV42_16750 [Candidatus Riflebacteria bacterium HGW-Riflebacteria-2]|jgi:hypothetical protein|nr:MAG: hypothetical protein CVV42_16750 [Candidatus Riflebacteria bacterium HGW-Riflebacteria-2]
MRYQIFYGLAWLFALLVPLPVLSQTEMPALAMDFVRGRVFFNSPDNEPYEARVGQHLISSSTSLITLVDGQCFFTAGEGETRLKQETILALTGRQQYELRQGLAGFKTASAAMLLTTAHCAAEFSNAIVVVKANPVLTRLCVVKGSVLVKQGRQSATVPAGHEIAAAPQRLSKIYRHSDELRFTWYWVDAAKEPALQKD